MSITYSIKVSSPMALRSDVVRLRIDDVVVVVPIVVTDPRHREGEALLVAALRHEVEVVVRAEQEVAAAGVGRVGVEDVAGRVLVEDARARGLRLARVLPLLVVVIGVALRDVFLRERHAIVAVEVVPVGGDPLEAPTHPLPERSELRVGRPRDREERHVAVREVHERPVDVIREERAAPAAFLPLRREHEVVDDELAPAVEEVGERLLTVRPVEDIARLHADPGEPASLRAQLIAAPRDFLLLLEELLPGDEPLVARHDSRTIHLALLRSGARARPAPTWGLHGASSRGARRGRRSRSRPRPTSRRLQCKSGTSAILLRGSAFRRIHILDDRAKAEIDIRIDSPPAGAG